jgi:hypothetical protein
VKDHLCTLIEARGAAVWLAKDVEVVLGAV